VVIGYTASSLLLTFSQLFFLRRTIPLQQSHHPDNRQWVRQMWTYSLPFSTWGIFTWMQQVSDRWALQAYASTVDVGQYAVLMQLGFTPISLVTGLVTSFLGPILYQRSGDATDHSRNAHVHQLSWRIVQLSILVTLLSFIGAFALHGWIFRLLVAEEYRSISYLLPWVVMAGGIFASGQMLALKLMSEMKSAEMKTAKIATALFGIFSNVMGAALAGMLGVVCALVAFSAIHFIWMAMLARHLSVKKD
jgi:O-antigen/teichoic acid export membrane protein